ncbi:MAG: class I mannose-6-phosphate isomerase [Chitinophaga sp.]|uniref:class I mannose-6-phosphate isomerase n=1 Tax=Chitinophaga sp. TaxID=1869181 RepID=UPI001B05E993|nr:class I mannose-6-phosphate isomerase [Chitinophaga sp.]MBO9727955.1 class I mannose-6-phosphate isomerase [Chitinophaga sp.]
MLSSTQAQQMTASRATAQYLIPLTKDKQHTGYDIYPSFPATGPIYTGFDTLAHQIAQQSSNIVLDGYGGVLWESFIEKLQAALAVLNIDTHFVAITDALLPSSDINSLIASSIGGEDPLFGKRFTGTLSDFFAPDKLQQLQPIPGKLNIVYGCGASLAGWSAPIFYIDVPKNEIQFRSRAGKVCNLGQSAPGNNPKLQYKQFYFVDWPALNRHKKQLLPQIDIIIDEQRINDISWCTGATLRDTLGNMTRNSFRARPWFEPGVWGGQWIKEQIPALNPDVVNYAWSFELIAPENGVLLESDDVLLEVTFDTLQMLNNEALLGKAAARFPETFPIRFDFLDTFDGGNLSVQCHPSVAYTKENFGEDFTQDETYYILDAKPDAKVYLGFQENINAAEFEQVLHNSFQEHQPVDIEKYVQVFPSHKHDLFLIPNGTVHSSGKNNLVLEISATPYIFTFKMYDWLRADLSGQPRTLNIDRAFANLDFERKGEVVKNTLLSQPMTIQTGHDWQIVYLPTHPQHFYRIERLEFNSVMELTTAGQCHILSLVEGSTIKVITNGREQTVHYAETFIIPAATGSYTLVSENEPVKVVRSFMKEECC